MKILIPVEYKITTEKIFFGVLIFLPPLYILYSIYFYGFKIPYCDQWEFVTFLEKSYTGKLMLSDFLAQHNEHRLFFPRLIMFGLASLSDWNIVYELYTNLFLSILTLLFLYSLYRQSIGNTMPLWLIVVFSFLVFSIVQWENWLWGWQIAIFLNVLATIIAVWAVVKWPGKLKGILFAIVAAFVASYSFSNGLLTWVIIGMLLLVQKKRKWRYIALWATVFTITTVLYYYKYTKPASHPSLFFFLNHPYDFIKYVLAYIGSPVCNYNKDIAIIIGLLSVVILCVIAIHIKCSSPEKFYRLLPWMVLALYAFLSAAVTGIGRAGFGVSQSLASRYTTISTLFIISALVVIVFWVNDYLRINKQLSTKWVIMISSVSIVLILSYLLSCYKGKIAMADRKAKIDIAAECLKNFETTSDECLKMLYPNTDLLRKRAKILSEMGLSFWKADKILEKH